MVPHEQVFGQAFGAVITTGNAPGMSLSATHPEMATMVLDLLEANVHHLLALQPPVALSEADGIVPVVAGDFAADVILAVVGGRLEGAGGEENLEPAGERDGSGGVERRHLDEIREVQVSGGERSQSQPWLPK